MLPSKVNGESAHSSRLPVLERFKATPSHLLMPKLCRSYLMYSFKAPELCCMCGAFHPLVGKPCCFYEDQSLTREDVVTMPCELDGKLVNASVIQ